MSRRRRLVSLVIIVSILSVFLFAAITAGRDVDGLVPVAEGAQTFPTAGIAQFFDYEYASKTPVPYQRVSHMIIPWYELQTGNGTYDWSELDDWIDQRGVAEGMALLAGFNATDLSWRECQDRATNGSTYTGWRCWDEANGGRQDYNNQPSFMLTPANEDIYYVVCPTAYSSTLPYHRIPKYWSLSYLAQMSAFATAMADHLVATNRDEYLTWIQYPLGVYGENHPSGSGSVAQSNCMSQAPNSLSWIGWLDVTKQITDIWDDAFAGTAVELSTHTTNYYLDRANRRDLGDYAATAANSGSQHTKLHPDANDVNIIRDGGSNRTGQYDVVLNWIGDTSFISEHPDVAWDNSEYDGTRVYKELNEAQEDYWNLAWMIMLGGDVAKLRLYQRDSLKRLTTENPYVMDQVDVFNEVAGTDATNSPFAVVYFRDSEWGYYPYCGDFGWLASTSSSWPSTGSSTNLVCRPKPALADANARPDAVWNVDDSLDPGSCTHTRGVYDADCDPRLRFMRVLDGTHDRVYVDMANEYTNNTDDVTFEFTFANVGTDTILVKWYNAAGALQTSTYTKTNTGELVTWTQALSGVRMTDPFVSGTTRWDFEINRGTGSQLEYLHSFLVRPSAVGDPTATATPTVNTPTPTPTATNTPTVFPTMSAVIVTGTTPIRSDDFTVLLSCAELFASP